MNSLLKKCKNMDKKFSVAILLFAALILVILGFGYLKETIINSFVAKQMPTNTVVTAEGVSEILWEPQIQTVGSVRAKQSVDIAPEVSGRVTEIFFTSGMVEAGDLLVQLNPDVLQAQLDSAKAKYQFTKLTYERQLALLRQNAGQQQSVDSAEADMNAAKAMIDQIQAQLNQLAIKAPFAGKLGLRYVDVGQYVSPGTKLVNLQSTNPMEVDFSVPEVLLGKLTLGLPVTVKSLAYPDQSFIGRVFAVNSQIDLTSRGLSVRATVDNENSLLIPAMFVNITIHLSGGEHVVVISQTAINYSQVGDYVYVVENGKAVKRYIELGERREGYVVVLSGLKAGESVITTGQLKLHDGAPVEVQTKTPPSVHDKADDQENNKA